MSAKRMGVAVAAFAILATGCGRVAGDGPGAGGSGGSGGSGATGSISHPAGPDELVLRVEYQGGFVPYEFALSSMPILSLFGDGTLVTQGAQIEIYPQPALPSLVRTRISEEGVQAILAAARQAGLTDGDANYGDQCIADAATTVFTTNANGSTSVVSAYALDVGEPAGTCGGNGDAEARAALAAFQAKLGDLKGWLPEGAVGVEEPFETKQMRVYVLPYQGDPELPQSKMTWPLDEPLAAFGEPLANGPEARCGLVTGDAFDRVYAAAQSANQLTPWVSDGAKYRLILRPLLPDEAGC